MTLVELVVLYLLVGAVCGALVLTRGPVDGARVASATASVALWPLWGPFALARSEPPNWDPRGRSAMSRIERAIEEAALAATGTPMREVFSRALAARVLSEASLVAARVGELRALARREGFDVAASACRVRHLETNGAPERTIATARLQHESLLRLDRLLTTDVQALDDLADLLEALRAQLLLALYAGSSAEGAEALVSEVSARLEGLGAVMDIGCQEQSSA